MSQLKIDSLSVHLGGKPVVKGLTLSAQAGEMIALVGPNGAGKTSLLRAMVGLVPYQGQMMIAGHHAETLSRQARAALIGYLPQGHHLHWPLAVKDVVALGRFPLGARDPARLAPKDARAITWAMQQTATEDFAERMSTTLSGGERARVALARVLALEPKILLADEPTASLDPRFQIEVMDCLHRVAHSGALVVVVTHDLLLAARYCARVIVLDSGKKRADGAPHQALSDDILRDIFHVEAVRVTHDGRVLALPWRVL